MRSQTFLVAVQVTDPSSARQQNRDGKKDIPSVDVVEVREE